jgi:hypothetical protein
MSYVDLFGYAASALVVLTFYMKEMVPLRAAALCSNVCFLAYGISLKLGPVVLLHAMLIPINIWRLTEVLSSGKHRQSVLSGCRFLRKDPGSQR